MDTTTARIVKQFIQKIIKKFTIQKVILFGSRARGDNLKSSDIDLVIVSSDFEGIHITERMKQMYTYWNAPYDVDFLCYTPEEFEKLSNMITIVREAVKHGIVIK